MPTNDRVAQLTDSPLPRGQRAVISFIVPAHNEELLIGRALEAIHRVAGELGEPYEIVVVDDASTDRTVDIAQAGGARVIKVTNRQIAATRNAGARKAGGQLLFFIDADTFVAPAAVAEAVAAMRHGAVDGGCIFRFDGRLPLWTRIVYPLAVPLMRLARLVGGCCLFCTREAYAATGGFCEEYYAAEEIVFIAALKRQGRFIVPRARVITSGRKTRTLSGRAILALMVRLILAGPAAFRSRDGLDAWYGPRQADPEGNALET